MSLSRIGGMLPVARPRRQGLLPNSPISHPSVLIGLFRVKATGLCRFRGPISLLQALNNLVEPLVAPIDN